MFECALLSLTLLLIIQGVKQFGLLLAVISDVTVHPETTKKVE